MCSELGEWYNYQSYYQNSSINFLSLSHATNRNCYNKRNATAISLYETLKQTNSIAERSIKKPNTMFEQILYKGRDTNNLWVHENLYNILGHWGNAN